MKTNKVMAKIRELDDLYCLLKYIKMGLEYGIYTNTKEMKKYYNSLERKFYKITMELASTKINLP